MPHLSTWSATDLKWTSNKEMGFLFRAKKYLSSTNLYTFCISQLRLILESCCHNWEGQYPHMVLGILRDHLKEGKQAHQSPGLYLETYCLAHHRRALAISPSSIGTSTAFVYMNSLKYLSIAFQLWKTPETIISSVFLIPRVFRLWSRLEADVFPSPLKLLSFNRLNIPSLYANTSS